MGDRAAMMRMRFFDRFALAARETMLAFLDRTLTWRHVALATGAAILWFAAMTWASFQVLPRGGLFRCPIGFCVTGYSANGVTLSLQLMGVQGRATLQDMLLPLDRVWPLLVLLACVLNTAWWTRPGDRYAIRLEPKWRYVLMVAPVVYCLADYGENWAFGAILKSYPRIGYRDVMFASSFTAVKSQLIVASLGIVVALAVAAWIEGRRSGTSGEDQA